MGAVRHDTTNTEDVEWRLGVEDFAKADRDLRAPQETEVRASSLVESVRGHEVMVDLFWHAAVVSLNARQQRRGRRQRGGVEHEIRVIVGAIPRKGPRPPRPGEARG